MNNQKPVDSSTNTKKTSKKTPPPPLRLPAPHPNVEDEEISQTNKQTSSLSATTTMITQCCPSSEQCSHQSISYTLPVCQRPKILDTLINSSSKLLVSSSTAAEVRHRKSHYSLNSQQINFLKQLNATRQNAIHESEWLDFLRLILQKSFEDELILLLEKYRKTYFDRVNSPNTTDETIRATLCDMVSQSLVTYSYNATSSSPTEQTSSSLSINKTSKRKRDDSSRISCEQSTINLTNQTKFVISSIIPDQNFKINSNQKSNNQQRIKQFQKKFSHLFKYIPTTNEQLFLTRQGHLKSLNDNQICLMLYDEIVLYMDDSDLEISGISVDNSFTLNESILEHQLKRMTWLNQWLMNHLPLYKYALNQADPRTDDWFLLWKDPIPSLTLTGLYFLIIYIGPRIMQSTKPVQIPISILFSYNMILAILSVYIVEELVVGAYLNNYNMICESLTVSYDQNQMKIPRALWFYYISKAIEFFDTFFMILRKRSNQITFLHVFHHSSMFLIWWIVLTWAPSGQAWFGPLLNSVVHVFMYSYYGLSVIPSLKDKLWWKKYLTMFQLVQFVLVFFHTTFGLVSGCSYPLWGQCLLSIYMIIMLVLFRNYYVHEYVTKSNNLKRSKQISTEHKEF